MFTKDYRKKLNRVIYVYLSKEQKIFYIGICLKGAERETYRHNIKGRRYYSSDFIAEMEGIRPCMFILDEIKDTERVAVRHKIVWTKIFMDNGYESFNSFKINDYAEDLFVENNELYQERKKINLDEFLTCENCFIQRYKNILCERESEPWLYGF